MNITEKKEVLLDIVKEADEKLTRLLIALADEYNSSEEYTNEEMEGFYKVRDEFIKHPETGRTVEEAHHLIRNNKRK
ncbi:MAG TPA: hypothetical protein VN726_10815 [Hanamia sp.]|nr:hypothetical protein [Hanamia sp.]